MGRFLVLFLLALAVPALPVAATCGCPEAAGSETPLLSVASGIAEWVVCGEAVGKDGDRLLVAELEVRRCGSAEPAFQCAALQTCRLERRVGALVVTELEELPFGPDWEWIDVPSVEHVITLGADGATIDKARSVLAPPRVSAADTERIHAGVRGWEGLDADAQEDLLYQTLALALGNDTKARQNLTMLRGLTWVGNLEDAYDEVVEIYEAYATRSGRVPSLAPAAPAPPP